MFLDSTTRFPDDAGDDAAARHGRKGDAGVMRLGHIDTWVFDLDQFPKV